MSNDSWPGAFLSLGKPVFIVGVCAYVGWGAFAYSQAPIGSPFTFLGITFDKGRTSAASVTRYDQLRHQLENTSNTLGLAREEIHSLKSRVESLVSERDALDEENTSLEEFKVVACFDLEKFYSDYPKRISLVPPAPGSSLRDKQKFWEKYCWEAGMLRREFRN